MAFNKAPTVSTYQTKPIQLVNEFDNRDGGVTKDLDFQNCFFEIQGSKLTGEKKIHVIRREGLSNYIHLISTNVRGVYYWEDENKILVATDNDITIYNSDTTTLLYTLSNIFSTSSGDVGFSEFLYDDNTVKIVSTDGTTLGTITNAGVWAASVSPDIPTPHLPQPVFLDGYLFIVKNGTADIYNSNLNDPLLYTAGDFISCEMFPDTILKVAKLNNYILAFGSASIEYFWDAANLTGSPLQRNDTPVKLVGYLGGFAQSGNQIYFVGSTSTATPDIYVIEDFKITPVSNETTRRYLESLSSNLSTINGNIVSFSGHEFYVMAIGSNTYVLDLKLGSWYRWSFQQQDPFSLEQAISVKSNTTYTSTIYITGQSYLFKFTPTSNTDISVIPTTTIITNRQLFDTYNQKSMNRLIIHGDRPEMDAYIGVSWSDDDYKTWSSVRQINLNQEIPCDYRLGKFRRRAFKLTFTEDSTLRLEGMEAEINIGNA